MLQHALGSCPGDKATRQVKCSYVMRENMKKLEIKHPYFQSVEYDDSQCWVTLNEQFPIKGFRLALVEPLSNYIEVGSDVGFRYADGEIDWFWGHGETIEEATVVALQNFINIIVHPDNLSSDNFVKREVIA